MTTKKDWKISIIIVHYQARSHLLACLASVQTFCDGWDYEVIVVNNDAAPLDLPAELLPEGRLRMIHVGDNIGYGRACNRGAEVATGELLFFLNPDTLFPSQQGSLTALLTPFADSQVGIVAPQIVSTDGTPQPWSAGVQMTPWELFLANIGLPRSRALWAASVRRSVGWVTGAAFLMRRNLFAKQGGFDEGFFLYYEDVDLCRRVWVAGYTILREPAVTVQHSGGVSSPDARQQKQHYYAAQAYYIQKYYGRVARWVVEGLQKFV